MRETKFKSNQKLWRIVKTIDGYYYILKLAGRVVSQVKLKEEEIKFFKEIGEIKNETKE